MADKPPRGLADVIAASTAVSDIDGRAGLLFYRGYDIHQLAGSATFEETAFLLQRGHAPSAVYLRRPVTSCVTPVGRARVSAGGAMRPGNRGTGDRKQPQEGNQTVRPQSLHRQTGEPCGGALHSHRRHRRHRPAG